MFPPLNADLTKGVALSVDHAAETNADEVVRIRTAGCAQSGDHRDAAWAFSQLLMHARGERESQSHS